MGLFRSGRVRILVVAIAGLVLSKWDWFNHLISPDVVGVGLLEVVYRAHYAQLIRQDKTICKSLSSRQLCESTTSHRAALLA